MRKCRCGGDRIVKQKGRGSKATIYIKCKQCGKIEEMGTLLELTTGVLKIQDLIQDMGKILQTRTKEPGGMVNEWI